MNLVLFVTIFLLIFGAISHSYFESYHKFQLEARTIQTYLTSMRLLRNKIEQRNSKRLKKTAKESLPTSPSHATSPTTPSWNRNYYPPNKDGKISLFPLMEVGKSSPLLYKIVLDYLHRLYRHTSFYKADLMKPLLDALIQRGLQLQHSGEPVTFTALYPKEKNLHDLYYKLLRGTNKYTTKSPSSPQNEPISLIGIPPFTDFFSLEKKRQVSISFPFAPLVLLEVLFGQESTQAIYNKEQEHREKKIAQDGEKNKKKASPTLSKDELIAIIKNNSSSAQIMDILSFSQKKRGKVEVEDGNTIGMWVRENTSD